MDDSCRDHADDSRRILVVDASQLSRHAIARSLQRWGFEVVDVASGEEALVYLRQRMATVLITDHDLPGMDGLALVGAAVDLHPGLPVILMSAHLSPELLVAAQASGVREVLNKQAGGEPELWRAVGTALAPREPQLEQLELAHSLRTPLTALKGAIEVLCRSDLPEPQRRFAGMAQRNVDRVVSLIERLLVDPSARP